MTEINWNEATPRPVDTCPDCGETGGHTERCNDQPLPLFQTEQGEEIERLKAEIEARDIPPAFDMPAFSTIDRSSLNYKAGWNAYRKAMIAASKGEGSEFIKKE